MFILLQSATVAIYLIYFEVLLVILNVFYVAGDLLIVIACIVTSSQMVYEEKYVKRYGVHPLRAVGSEGLCGFVVLAGLLIVMYFIKGIPAPFSCGPEERLEDVPDALAQMRNNYIIIIATVGKLYARPMTRWPVFVLYIVTLTTSAIVFRGCCRQCHQYRHVQFCWHQCHEEDECDDTHGR